jgi:hypothetical protein
MRLDLVAVPRDGPGETASCRGRVASRPSATGVIQSNVEGQRRQGMIDADQMQAINQALRFVLDL